MQHHRPPGSALCLYWQHVTAAPPCISMSHSTCLSSARMRVLGPLAFGLYRTLHFAVDTTLRTRTICYERVKATSLRLLLFNMQLFSYRPHTDQLCSHRSNSITHIIQKYYSVRFLCLQCCAKTKTTSRRPGSASRHIDTLAQINKCTHRP